jgi:uncharacterized protein
MFLDPLYFLLIGPAFLLALFAQFRVKSAYAQMSKVPARMSGAQAARRMLDSAGLHNVPIEMVGGTLSDHYDPRGKVVRLSHDVYNGRSMASVGIACHEAGHALQDAHQYAPLVLRNLAVPIAGFGSGAGIWLFIGGMLARFEPLMLLGLLAFSAVVFFQLVNLPVEFNASARAREQLVDHGIIAAQEEKYVARVLNAAALTYVAATLQAVLTLLYLIFRFAGSRD